MNAFMRRVAIAFGIVGVALGLDAADAGDAVAEIAKPLLVQDTNTSAEPVPTVSQNTGAYDVRLDEAFAALQKAAALVESLAGYATSGTGGTVAVLGLLAGCSRGVLTGCSQSPSEEARVGAAKHAIWSPRWEVLAADAGDAPAICSWGPGRLDVFWRDPTNVLRHKYRASATSAWQDDPGWSVSNGSNSPSCVSWGSGRIDVFWRGSLGALMHRKYVSGTGWGSVENLTSLGGWSEYIYASGSPAAASWSSGRLDVFWRGTDRKLKHAYDPNNSQWSSPEPLGTMTLSSDPTAVSSDYLRYDVFYRLPDGSLGTAWYNNGWNYGSLGETDVSTPAAASWGPGRLDVFWRGPTNELRHRWYRGGWSPNSESLGGDLTSAPSAVSTTSDEIDVVVRGAYGNDIEHLAWKTNGDQWPSGGPWHNDPPPDPTTGPVGAGEQRAPRAHRGDLRMAARADRGMRPTELVELE